MAVKETKNSSRPALNKPRGREVAITAAERSNRFRGKWLLERFEITEE